MTGLFSTVLNMSLVGSLTAAVIFLIRWCLKRRAPRWISYALWAVVLIRLFVPVSISSPMSLFSLLPSHSADIVGESGRLSQLDVTGGAAVEYGRLPAVPSQVNTGAAGLDKPLTTGQNDGQGLSASQNQTAVGAGRINWQEVAATVWVCGTLALSGFLTVHYIFSAVRLPQATSIP